MATATPKTQIRQLAVGVFGDNPHGGQQTGFWPVDPSDNYNRVLALRKKCKVFRFVI